MLQVQKVLWLHCANKKLETYQRIWHNKCYMKNSTFRLVSFTLQRPSEDPNWTASTPDRKPARPTCKDSTTSFGLTGRPSWSNQQTTVWLLYRRYMYIIQICHIYIHLLCIVYSLYIMHWMFTCFVIIYWLPDLLSKARKAPKGFTKNFAWKNHRGVGHRSLVVCCNLQSHNLRGFKAGKGGKVTGELRN